MGATSAQEGRNITHLSFPPSHPCFYFKTMKNIFKYAYVFHICIFSQYLLPAYLQQIQNSQYLHQTRRVILWRRT